MYVYACACVGECGTLRMTYKMMQQIQNVNKM